MYFLRVAGPVMEIYDFVTAINNLASAKRVQAQLKTVLAGFAAHWKHVHNLAASFSLFLTISNADRSYKHLLQHCQNRLANAAQQCNIYIQSVLPSLERENEQIKFVKDTRIGFVAELLMDVFSAYLAPSPIVFVSVARFFLEYEVDFCCTWITETIKELKR